MYRDIHFSKIEVTEKVNVILDIALAVLKFTDISWRCINRQCNDRFRTTDECVNPS